MQLIAKAPTSTARPYVRNPFFTRVLDSPIGARNFVADEKLVYSSGSANSRTDSLDLLSIAGSPKTNFDIAKASIDTLRDRNELDLLRRLAVKSNSPIEVAKYAVDALGTLNTPLATRILKEIVAHKGLRPGIRETAVDALEQTRAIEVLVHLGTMKQIHPKLQERIKEALARLENP